MPDLRFGSVPYLNARPLTEGLPAPLLDVPARLTERFLAGEVDVALLPSFAAVRDEWLAVVPGASVSSPGPVDSVLLFSRGPLAAARRVLLDESSLTSAALTRVLFARHLGVRPEFAPATPDTDPREADGDALLLIGDPAMRAPREGLVVTDLASLWREWTGLPFCFAVWVARDGETAERAAPAVAAAKERGLAARSRIAADASPALGLPPEALTRYLVERITYDLGGAEREALTLFGSHCRELRLA